MRLIFAVIIFIEVFSTVKAQQNPPPKTPKDPDVGTFNLPPDTVPVIIPADTSIVTNPKVLRGIGNGCDEEAQRLLKHSPKWNPGMQNGKTVRVQYIIPVTFKLN